MRIIDDAEDTEKTSGEEIMATGEEISADNKQTENDKKALLDMTGENALEYKQEEDGTWNIYDIYFYKYCNVVSGVLPNSDKRSTFVVLSQIRNVSFQSVSEMAMASAAATGISSQMQIVEHIVHDYNLKDGRYVAQLKDSQKVIDLKENSITISDLSDSFYGIEYEYMITGDTISIENENQKSTIRIVADNTLEYNGIQYAFFEESERTEKIVVNKTGIPQYDELLDKMLDVHKNNSGFKGYESIDVCYVYGYESMFEIGGFYLIDLDNDGTMELLLGENGNDAWRGVIYNIYTIKAGQLVRVCNGGERSTYKLCEGNIIKNSGSSGAAHSTVGFYTFENGGLVFKQGLVYDGDYDSKNPWFICGEDFRAENGISVTWDEANALEDEYVENLIEFTTFIEKVYE